METSVVHASFLGAGPGFSFDVPSEFDRTPELSCPLLNGYGGRLFVFVPEQRVEPLEKDNAFIGTLTDREGRAVEYFERLTPPPLWRLRWELSSGTLYTHLREEDPPQMAKTTVESVAVLEDQLTALPTVLAYPPLEYGASMLPGYDEAMVFTSRALGSGHSIALTRPGSLSANESIIAERELFEGLAVVRLGLGSGIDAQVTMGGDAAVTKEVAAALRESFEVV